MKKANHTPPNVYPFPTYPNEPHVKFKNLIKQMKLNDNKKRLYQHIVKVYTSHKQADIPDTYIVRVVFPKHGIFISYRHWTRIKGKKPSEMQ